MMSKEMLSVEDARQRILDTVHPLNEEAAPLDGALGRTLARDVVAREALPAFVNSAMDGYAVRSDDTRGATAEAPAHLRLVGEVPAGKVYAGMVSEGEAVRILTGAALPIGADAVLEQELTGLEGAHVLLHAEVLPGRNLRPIGDDVPPGTLLAPRGTEIGPAEIALLAAFGIHPVQVARQPRVVILSTGDELTPLGETPGPGQIRETNGLYLAAAVARAGGSPIRLALARDRAEEIRARLAETTGADLILTSGGVSVGDYDLVKLILAEEGTVDFWRVRMRPGKPVAFGLLGGIPMLGLPGNPVSAAVTFELFGRPAIRKMLGSNRLERPLVEVELDGEEIERSDRRHFVRAQLRSRGGMLVATPTGSQASHRIASLQEATALLVIMEGEGMVRIGEHLQALLLNDAGMPWGS
jgi:molybdopterin molybdotransferase